MRVVVRPETRRLRSGAHFLALGAAATASNDEGYMTSVAYSPSLGHWIGIGLLRSPPPGVSTDRPLVAMGSSANHGAAGRHRDPGADPPGGGA